MAAPATTFTICGADSVWMREWRSKSTEPVSSRFIHYTCESMSGHSVLLYDRHDLSVQLLMIDNHARAIISALKASYPKDLSGAPIPIASARVQLAIIADDLVAIAEVVTTMMDTQAGKDRWGADDASRKNLQRLIAPLGSYAESMRGYK